MEGEGVRSDKEGLEMGELGRAQKPCPSTAKVPRTDMAGSRAVKLEFKAT